MPLTVSLLSPGAMGSAIAARLVGHGATVLTSLDERGAASRQRAEQAGMVDATPAQLVEADLILSILPPGEALALAQRLAPALSASTRKPLFVDCNALSPDTKRSVGAVIDGTGCAFADACIIGLPPRNDQAPSPVIHVAGDRDNRTAPLAGHGLDIRRMDGDIGAAAALKMSYAGINKGLTGLGAAMVLAADRAGAGAALRAELEASLPHLAAKFDRAVPDMYAKAYRWVAEMREIAAFSQPDEATALIFEGLARLFERLAADQAGDRHEVTALDHFLGR